MRNQVGRALDSIHAPASRFQWVTSNGPAAQPETGFWAALPRGARLDEDNFTGRHRIVSGVLAAHVPVLLALAYWQRVGGALFWGYLIAIAVTSVLGFTLRGQGARASATSVGL